MSELRRFSHSLVDAYLDCPRRACYRYVEDLPWPRSPALVKGTACDAAWNENLLAKIETGSDLEMDELLELTASAFDDQRRMEDIDWQGQDPAGVRDSALILTKMWRLHLAPDIQPAAVQVRYERVLPSGRTFIGFVDAEGLVEGAPAVIDNKTGSRRFAVGEADKSLQPYAYAWLRQEPVDFVFARALDTGKSAASEFAWTHRSEDDIAWYGAIVEDVERAFEQGIFPANPRSMTCGPKHCPFYARCQPHRVVSGPTR